MGYCIQQIDSKIFIPAKDVISALTALNEGPLNPDEISGGKATVNYDIHASRWGFKTDKIGNVVDIWFEGEKGHNDDELKPLAPYVKSGSYVEMMGEDGNRWKWEFKDGKIITKSPKITYE